MQTCPYDLVKNSGYYYDGTVVKRLERVLTVAGTVELQESFASVNSEMTLIDGR